MTSVVDDYLDARSQDGEADDVFPCKGCGEILEEGKAFELAGNRWHLDCFRCNTCGTLLDSDANLLLLGDGSLICNNCTYSCSACGDKIEDLAILTGDQAFCAACFRCRNCKRKIENLRYARTSQGIFCMDCHESIMQRRKKRSKAAAAAKAREKDRSPMITEKSLPALPPNVIPNNAFSNDRVDPESDTPTELSPRPRLPARQNDSSRGGPSRSERSPERHNSNSSRPEGLGLPAHTYSNNRNSTIISSEPIGRESEDGFFIPVALDPSPAPSAPSRAAADSTADPSKRKDYFSPKPGVSERRNDSASSTPHIAFQEKSSRQASDLDESQNKQIPRKVSKSSPAIDSEPMSRSSPARRPANQDGFKLQEAPKTRQLLGNSQSSSEQSSPPQELTGSPVPPHSERDQFAGKLAGDSGRSNENTPPRPSQEMRSPDEDSLGGKADSTKLQKPVKRKELPSSRNLNGKSVGPVRSSSEDSSLNQPAIAELPVPAQESYVQPRTAPLPPSAPSLQHSKKASVGSKDEQEKHSPKLPRWSSGGDFSLDEDMARILGTDEPSSSILRRVSNVVRHGRTGSVESIHNAQRASHSRSISETTRTTTSPRWPKTPHEDRNGGHDIVSPLSGAASEDPVQLKRQLTSSQRRVAELERQFDTENDLKSLNKKLIEKRKTVSVLDTQSEIMIRQIEVLAGFVERAKDTKTPIDPRQLEDSALKEFVQKLEKLKLSMSEAIEQLHEERDKLLEEKNQAVADRDRALIEFEQLSSKNAQLADMNNDLTHQIQERFKSQLGQEMKSPNGLGIYSQQRGNGSSVNLDASSVTTGPTLVGDDETIVESGPTVVQVRKGQVKKFNWKKGGKSMAHNVSKGLNRAVVAFQNDRERMQQQAMSGDNIGMPYNTTVTAIESPSNPSVAGQGKLQGDPGRQGFGFFGKKNAMPKSISAQNVQVQAAVEAPSVLFGSELMERADFERRQIPSIVTRCIEEVELRGMDQEGIYRKSGGSSQINTIKDGFDRNENFDISDPDLDIAAVTSVLKQYFRKLPTPLLTYDIYDQVLESTSIVDESERCAHLRRTFSTMPQSHRDCLEFLMFHLDRVAQRERENLMSPKNLAVVFAPTIMRDLSIEREMTDMHAKNLAVQFVIENSQTIFGEA